MDASGTISFAELEELLSRLDAKLAAREVHALYLGALTSTNLRLGPQQLLGHIFGEAPMLGDSMVEANSALQTVFGYWNTLVEERKAAGVRLAPDVLAAEPTRADVLAFAKRRHDEIQWFVRGIDAGGDDPIEFGPEGEKLLEGIATGSSYLQAYVEMLGSETSAEPKELKKARRMLLELVATVERQMGVLRTVSDAVRREAMNTFAAHGGRSTDDGGQIARAVKVGRNEKCPCGSGKKWKKCCGAASTLQ